ncbi:MAG: presenilin family intramembrane aspartyl protease PSH [Candidatus Thermoplasmatota archaeon]
MIGKVDKKEIIASLIMVLFFLVIHGIALFLAGPFEEAGVKTFENPEDPLNIAFILIILLAFTGIILLIAKFWKKRVIHLIVLGAIGYTSAYVFYPVFNMIFTEIFSLILAIIAAVVIVLLIFYYPEWYILDLCGIVVGAGAIAIFGISLSIPLVILLLSVLSVYDAISVYKTKHMVDLADTVMDLKLPVLLVVPKVRNYSLLKKDMSLKANLKKDKERDAFFVGLGDVVMPGILVVSVFHNIPHALFLSLGVILGTLVGFAVLMTFVIKGRPQAGLPSLCGGAIAGYLVFSLLLFGKIVGFSGVS